MSVILVGPLMDAIVDDVLAHGTFWLFGLADGLLRSWLVWELLLF